MEPLILKFRETPTENDLKYDEVEYSSKLNLTVLKGTEDPAVDFLKMETETFTKAQGEGSDTDKSGVGRKLRLLMETMTETHAQLEGTDKDPSTRHKFI